MPQAPHTLRVPAALAITEATRAELVDFGTNNLRTENVRQAHRGEASPRYGFKALTSSGTVSSVGTRLFADGTSIVQISDDATGFGGVASTFNDATGGAWSTLPGRISQCITRLIGLPSLGNTTHVEDIAYTNGYFCVTWSVIPAIGSGSMYAFAAVIDELSGTEVSAPVQVGAVGSSFLDVPLLVVDGLYFILVRANAGASTIKASYLYTVNTSSINTGWVAMTDLATDFNNSTATHYAVCSLPDATNHRAALVYGNTSGGTNRLTVKTFGQGGVLQTTTINTSSVVSGAIDIQGSIADTLWVAWNEATLIKMQGLNPTSITTVTATTGLIMTASGTTTNVHILPSSLAPTTGRLLANDGAGLFAFASEISGFKITAGAAAPSTSQTTVYGVQACSRPFFYQGLSFIHVFVGDVTNAQKQVMLVDWTDNLPYFRPVSNPSPGLGTVSQWKQCSMVTGSAAGKFYFGLGITKSSVADATTLCEYDFKSTKRWAPVSFAGSTYLTGGVALQYDGRRLAEVGFLVRPLTPTATVAGTGVTGTYRYVCVYEEVDARGNWNVSGLSNPSAVITATNQTMTVSTLPLTVSGRVMPTAMGSSVRVAFYRTVTGGVAPYYRVGSVINDPTLATVALADNMPDATLSANAKLYSQPGVNGTSQDRRPPPGLGMLVSYNGMLVGATGSVVWYSGQSVDGEGTWFNPIFQIPVPGDGDISGLAVMDGTLFAFKRREVYGLTGDAPSDNGASGGVGLPRRLACDVGCIEARSTCTTALGVFFQSERGIELLTRAQSVEWVGQNVQDTLAAYPVVTSATLDASTSGAHVLIELSASESAGRVPSTGGRTLVYDMSLKDWIGVDRRTSSVNFVDAPSQSACVVYNGSAYRYAWMTPSGIVHIEDRTTYLDANGSFVTQLIETGWMNAFQQESRVFSATLLFQRYTAAGLSVEIAYNWSSTYQPVDAKQWTEAQTIAGGTRLEWRPRIRAEAMKFRISSTAPVTLGTGQGIGFIGLSLVMKPQQGGIDGSIGLDPALRK